MTHLRNPLYWVRAALCTIGILCATLVGASVLPREARCACQDPPPVEDNDEQDEDAAGVQVESGDDFAPGTQGETDTYAKSTLKAKFPGFDGTNIIFFETPAWRATTNLIGNAFFTDHCKDSGGTKRKHSHFQKDYDAAEKTNANNYWDLRFDTANKTTTRISGATNTTNCYVYALANFTKKGTYNYWINARDGEATACFQADTTSVSLKTDKAKINDVIVYGLRHASAIAGADCPGSPTTLQWQWAGSGIYKYAVPANAADKMHTPFFQRTELKDPVTNVGPGAADAGGAVRQPK